MEAKCLAIENNDGADGDQSDHHSQVQRGIFSVLAILSIISLMVVAISIFRNKKLKAHPSPLIARICIAEAAMCWNALMEVYEPKMVICYMGLYKGLRLTLG